MTAQPPDGRQLLRIGVVARRVGVTPDTVRYYERLGLLECARRSKGGYRLFEPSVTERLSFIRKGQALGLTLEEIKEVLDLSDAGTEPCRHVREALGARLADVDRRLSDLRSLRRALASALSRAEGCSEGEPCICGIIEKAATTIPGEEET